jgi:uncharacterized protein (TIGR02588 family)
MSERDEKGDDRERKADWLEIAATIFSGLLLIGLLGVLVRDGFHENAPAAVTAVAAGDGELRGESWYVPVAVENAGDEAVRDVAIGVEATENGEKVEGEFELDWLPGRSKREGVAVLPKGARGQPLKASVKGYVIP